MASVNRGWKVSTLACLVEEFNESVKVPHMRPFHVQERHTCTRTPAYSKQIRIDLYFHRKFIDTNIHYCFQHFEILSFINSAMVIHFWQNFAANFQIWWDVWHFESVKNNITENQSPTDGSAACTFLFGWSTNNSSTLTYDQWATTLHYLRCNLPIPDGAINLIHFISCRAINIIYSRN